MSSNMTKKRQKKLWSHYSLLFHFLERIAFFHEQKINQSAQEREREKKEREKKERQQMQENSRLDQERKKKSVQSNCLHLTAVQELQKDAEAIESQNQEDEDTPDFD